MRIETAIAMILSLLLALSSFAATDHWYVALGVGAVALLASFLFILPCVRAFAQENEKRHECYLFIHGYLVTLSVCMSLDKAFEAASQPMGKNFHVLDETLATMEPKEKTLYLANYFSQPIYRMFLSVLELYLDRGGDVLKLSNELTAEASRIEEVGATYQKQAARKAASFFFLYVMALAIVTFLRFGLSTFFSQLKQSWTYLGALIAFYAFLIASACIYVYFHTGKTPSLRKGAKRAEA